MKYHPGLLALSFGSFAIGVTEFAPMGLLPLIAKDIGVTIPAAGLVVSAFAFGVVVSAPLMVVLTAGVPPRRLLIAMAAIIALGNLMTAVAPGYSVLLLSRIFASFQMGAYYGAGAVVAASLVPPDRRARAVATMFMGLALSNVAGVPLAAWAGSLLGWRATFWVVAAVGCILMIALRLTLPALPAKSAGNPALELRIQRRPRILLAYAITTLSAGAWFTVYTFIAPILLEVTGASANLVSAALIVFGAGLSCGNWLGGRFADITVVGTLAVVLTGMIATLALYALAMPFIFPSVILLFLLGVTGFAIVAPLHVIVMNLASDAPVLAAAVNVGAFNLGNALGSALGGAMIAAGYGYRFVGLAGACAAGFALLLLLTCRSRISVTARSNEFTNA